MLILKLILMFPNVEIFFWSVYAAGRFEICEFRMKRNFQIFQFFLENKCRDFISCMWAILEQAESDFF